MADTIGELDIRGEHIEKAVKGFANKLYKLRPLLKQESSSDWQESYYSRYSCETKCSCTYIPTV